MINLILKDVLIQKKTFLYAIIYGIFSMIVFTSTLTARGAYMFGGMSIAYLLIIYSNGYDEKNKSEIILNSLPVRRDSIVTAKYVSIFLFFLLGVAITGVAGAVITPMNIIPGMRFMRLSDVLGIFISVGLMYSVYYPLYFKFGSLKLKIFNIVIYMLFLFVPNILVSIIEENPNDNIVRKVISIIEWSPAWMLQIFTIIVIMIVLIVSMEMSIKIYRNKEF
jgi:ABC-type transport system involved in multi-copper enzyme maturation permease subunit